MNPQPSPRPAPALGAWRAALVAVVVFGFLACLAGNTDFGRREARNAIVAREMILTGNHLVPTLGGAPRFEKPPLMYWAIVGAARLFNDGRVSEWVAAMPSALAGALTAMMVAVIAARFSGRPAGLLAAAVLVTSFGFYKWGRVGQIESLLTATVAMAVGAFILWDHQPRQPWRLIAGYALAAAGCMTKGPVALVFILAGAVAYGIACKLAGRPTRHFMTRWHAAGLAVFFALALPWPAAVMAQGDAKEVFMREIFGRLSGSLQRHTAGPFYYCGALPWLTAPWILALPLVAWRLWKERGALRQHHAPAIFLGVWFLAVFLFFSAVRTKQSFYILPILPAYAMLTAWGTAGIRWAERATRVVAGIAAAGLLVYFGIFAPRENFRRPPRQFAEAVHRVTGHARDALAFCFAYDQSPTVDLRAELFVYFNPDVRVVSVSRQAPPATAAEFAGRVSRYPFVVLSQDDLPEAWGATLPGFEVALAREIDTQKYVLLRRQGGPPVP